MRSTIAKSITSKMNLTSAQLDELHRYLRSRATRYPFIILGSRTVYDVSRADNVLYAVRSFIREKRIQTSNRAALALRACNQLYRIRKISILDPDTYRRIKDSHNCLVFIRPVSQNRWYAQNSNGYNVRWSIVVWGSSGSGENSWH